MAAVWALAGGAVAPGAARAQGAAPAVVYSFDDAAGGTSLQGGASLATGLLGAHGLHLPGRTGFAEGAAPAVDTTRSYTVSAWVKPAELRGFQTVASIDGQNVSGFYLQLRSDTGKFAFVVLPSDDVTAKPAVANATDEPEAGRWYNLTGVYDAAAHTITLYVDGVRQETVPVAPAWKATGRTAIGRGRYGGKPLDFATGDIDDVRFYQTALSAADVAAIVKPVLSTLPIAPAAAPPTLQINAAGPTVKLSPMFYGLMTEEINYSYDGGLYAELIRNRAFKDNDTEPSHWAAVHDGGAAGIALDTTQPPVSPALTTCLRLNVESAPAGSRVGVANDGYWGIPVRPNTKYRASFYAKSDGGAAPLTVSIESNDGATVYARASVPKVTTDWQQYAVTLTTPKGIAPTAATRFVITASRPGTVWLNLVSLFPPTFNNRPNGNRIDLMQTLAAMKPAFLRMPGGNYLEGDTIATRFDWKKTLGPISQRPGHMGPWSYRSTDGMGLLEFLEWCEDLKMEPLLAVYAGYSLRGEHVEPGAALQPFVQDALDEIEYVTGDVHTKWGAIRAADGHPKPWTLHYVEIGNEDFFDRSGSYGGRYAQFYDAIKAKYPTLQLIATTGVKTRPPDVIDEHYYRKASEFVQDTHHYDAYDRKGPKIFVGEWASQDVATPWSKPETKGPTPTLNSALGDAAWMTGMERNSDVVVLEAYAPLLVNVNPGGRQWAVNLIGYDALTNYGSPSYWVQVMFAGHHGDTVLPATVGGSQTLAQSVTRDSKTGTVYVKVVNPTAAAQSVRVTLSGVKSVASRGTAVVLAGNSPQDTNTITEPTRIVPRMQTVNGLSADFTHAFPPYSVTILQIGTK